MALRILAVICMLFVGGLAAAQQDMGRNTEIEATISNQMEAFKKDDFAAAFEFAAPGIKNIFGSPERFGAMVRQGYPMVWRPADVRYLELREIAGSLWQKVEVTDQRGTTHYLDYQMIEQDGVWKISGVQLLPSPGVNA